MPTVNDSSESNPALLFGSPVPRTTKRGYHETRLKDEASTVVQRWMHLQEDWISVAIDQGDTGDRAALSKTMCFKKDNDTVCWNLVELYRVDILRWFRDVGEPSFPALADIARVWLGKVSSTAFQERVFSTGGAVMSARRTRTDNDRAEMEMLLRHKRSHVHF
jgi:hypothetical protein